MSSINDNSCRFNNPRKDHYIPSHFPDTDGRIARRSKHMGKQVGFSGSKEQPEIPSSLGHSGRLTRGCPRGSRCAPGFVGDVKHEGSGGETGEPSVSQARLQNGCLGCRVLVKAKDSCGQQLWPPTVPQWLLVALSTNRISLQPLPLACSRHTFIPVWVDMPGMSLALSHACTGKLLRLASIHLLPWSDHSWPKPGSALRFTVRSTCPLHSQYKKAFPDLQAIVLMI